MYDNQECCCPSRFELDFQYWNSFLYLNSLLLVTVVHSTCARSHLFLYFPAYCAWILSLREQVKSLANQLLPWFLISNICCIYVFLLCSLPEWILCSQSHATMLSCILPWVLCASICTVGSLYQ